jgi:hypothetical protein
MVIFADMHWKDASSLAAGLLQAASARQDAARREVVISFIENWKIMKWASDFKQQIPLDLFFYHQLPSTHEVI